MEDIKLLYPIKRNDIWEWYKTARSKIWTEDRLVASAPSDLSCFVKMSKNEKISMNKVIAMFVMMEPLVMKNITTNITPLFDNEPEISIALAYHNYIESIHQITYSEFVRIYYNSEDIRRLEDEIKSDPSLDMKIKWAKKYMEHDNPIFKILAMIHMEGIQFQGGFDNVYYLRSRGYLPVFTTANEYISIDEKSHYYLFIMIFHIMISEKNMKVSNEDVIELIKSGTDSEIEYYKYMKEYPLLGFNYNDVKEQIKIRSDDMCHRLINKRIYFDKPMKLKYELNNEVQIRSTNFFTSISTNYAEVKKDKIEY